RKQLSARLRRRLSTGIRAACSRPPRPAICRRFGARPPMFVGHLAVTLAAKRAAPRVNLGWLMAGVTGLDLVWPVFVIAGVEKPLIAAGAPPFTPLVFASYPWSPSLVMAFVWGLVLVVIARRFGVPSSYSLLLVGLVVSHWVLDFISH